LFVIWFVPRSTEIPTWEIQEKEYWADAERDKRATVEDEAEFPALSLTGGVREADAARETSAADNENLSDNSAGKKGLYIIGIIALVVLGVVLFNLSQMFSAPFSDVKIGFGGVMILYFLSVTSLVGAFQLFKKLRQDNPQKGVDIGSWLIWIVALVIAVFVGIVFSVLITENASDILEIGIIVCIWLAIIGGIIFLVKACGKQVSLNVIGVLYKGVRKTKKMTEKVTGEISKKLKEIDKEIDAKGK
jgi:hypothetical protein